MFVKSCCFIVLLFVYACAVEGVREKTDQSANATADAQNSNTDLGLSTPDSKNDPAPGRNNRQTSDSARKSNSDSNLGKEDNDSTSRTSKSDNSGNINNKVISDQVDTMENKNSDNNLSYEPETEKNVVTDQNTCIDSNHDGKCDDAENLNENWNDVPDSVDDATDVNENQNDMSDNDDSTTQTPCYGADTDGDGTCDALDLDDDGDGIDDDLDICPLEYDPENLDTDKDGKCNGSDPDDDNDGLLDEVETNTGTFVSINDTGTDPLNSDTDGDDPVKYASNDKEEIDLGRNPNVPFISVVHKKSDRNGANSFVHTNDGGFIIAGYTNGYLATRHDAWLIKTDEKGSILWDKIYGGEGYDYANSIKQTSDGGFIIVGRTDSFGAGGTDAWLIKVDKNGDKLWEKTFGGKEEDYAYSIQVTSDGGFIIAGRTDGLSESSTDYGGWLIRVDTTGMKIWERIFKNLGESSRDEAVMETSDGSFVIIGTDISSSNQDALVIKTDATGEILWEKTFGGIGSDAAHAVIEAKDENIIVVGLKETTGANQIDFWLLKIDTNGEMIWEKMYGGKGYDYAYNASMTSDGGYIITGFNGDLYDDRTKIVRVDIDGNEIWSKSLDGYLYTIQQIEDGNYVLLGSTERITDVLLKKTDYLNP